MNKTFKSLLKYNNGLQEYYLLMNVEFPFYRKDKNIVSKEFYYIKADSDENNFYVTYFYKWKNYNKKYELRYIENITEIDVKDLYFNKEYITITEEEFKNKLKEYEKDFKN